MLSLLNDKEKVIIRWFSRFLFWRAIDRTSIVTRRSTWYQGSGSSGAAHQAPELKVLFSRACWTAFQVATSGVVVEEAVNWLSGMTDGSATPTASEGTDRNIKQCASISNSYGARDLEWGIVLPWGFNTDKVMKNRGPYLRHLTLEVAIFPEVSTRQAKWSGVRPCLHEEMLPLVRGLP